MRRLTILAALVAALALAACGSTPPDASETAQELRSGDARSQNENSETAIPVGSAFAQPGGDARNQTHNTRASTSRNDSATATGPSQQAFQVGGLTSEQAEDLRAMVTEDPLILGMMDEIARLLEAPAAERDTARIDALRSMIRETREEWTSAMAKAGGDMSSLRELHVFNWISGYTTGAAPIQLNEHEAEAVKQFAEALKAAQGGWAEP